MGKENEKKLNEKKNFCPSSDVPTLRWFQSAGAGELVKKLITELGADLTKN